MAENATARKPSPRPRSLDDPALDRPTLRVVPLDYTPPPTEAETGNLKPETEQAPTRRFKFPQVSGSDGANPEAARQRISVFWASTKAAAGRSRDYWTPPGILTDRPESVEQLAEYSRYAPWTAQKTGVIRAAGTAYWVGLALPYTAVSRYREWVVQRPARLVAHLGVIKLLSLTTPGIWVVDHLVYPVAQFAGHIFL